MNHYIIWVHICRCSCFTTEKGAHVTRMETLSLPEQLWFCWWRELTPDCQVSIRSPKYDGSHCPRTAKSLFGLRGMTSRTALDCQVSNRSSRYDGSPDFINRQQRLSRTLNRPEHESSPLTIQCQYLSEKASASPLLFYGWRKRYNFNTNMKLIWMSVTSFREF
jgi:hypothetical protein